MRGEEKEIKEVLCGATEVRRSKSDSDVYLYYREKDDHFTCVVVRHLDNEGFLITAYFTEAVKEGGLIWKR